MAFPLKLTAVLSGASVHQKCLARLKIGKGTR
jgi:hypothetical protein